MLRNARFSHVLTPAINGFVANFDIDIEVPNETQCEHGSTLECCMILGASKVKIESQATWDERHRYRNQFVLRRKDDKSPSLRDGCESSVLNIHGGMSAQ